MNAERPALADEPVEQKRGVLRDAVVFNEEFLKLVNDQERSGERRCAAGPLVAGQVLDAELAEEIAAATQLIIHPLQHAQTELPVALDGHHPRLRQFVGRVAFELDAFLEVHEVKLDLVRTAPQSKVGDDDVEQGGFAGAGLAGDEGMLAGAFAERELLELGRAGAPDRDAQFVGGLQSPERGIFRGDFNERHFDAIRIHADTAHLFQKGGGEAGFGRWIQKQCRSFQRFVGQHEAVAFGADTHARFAKVVRDKLHARRFSQVPMDESEHAATRPAGGDAQEAADGQITEVDREIGDDQEVIRLGDAARLFVVICNGRVFVAEIELGNLLDMLVQLGEALLEVIRLRPDAAIDEAVFVIREVHEAGEALPEIERVEDSEHHAAGRRAREQPQHQIVERSDRGLAS